MSEAIASILSTASDTARLRLQASNGEQEVDDEVLQQFEALFLQQMLKSMRTASLSDGLFQSEQSDFYRDMYDQQIAADLAKKEVLGISQIINRQLGGSTATESGSDDISAQAIPFEELSSKGIEVPENLFKQQNVAHELPELSELVDRLSTGLGKINIGEAYSDSVVTNDQPARPLAFKPETPDEFVDVAYEYAQSPAQRLGVDAEVLVAIAALETGWGNHLPQDANGNSNNYFGIKADERWQGDSVGSNTLEFEQGSFNQLKQSFRAYDSLKESFDDFADFILGNERYSQAVEVSHDTKKFLHEIQNAGYATDPKYADKILNVLSNKAFSR